MRRFIEHLYSILLTLWIGGLWTIGGVAAPVLFRLIDDRALAGRIAGEMFRYIGWIGLAVSAYLLLFVALRKSGGALRNSVFWLVLVMLLLTVASLFGLQPLLVQLKADSLPREVMENALRDRFVAWHGVSSVVYLIQCALGVMLVSLQERGLR